MDLKTATTTLTWVCVCCLQVLANDDTSGCEHYCTRGDEHPDGLLGSYSNDVELTLGMTWEEHERDCVNRINESWTDECDCERMDFSWRWCDGCDSRLGGERSAVTMWSAA